MQMQKGTSQKQEEEEENKQNSKMVKKRNKSVGSFCEVDLSVSGFENVAEA